MKKILLLLLILISYTSIQAQSTKDGYSTIIIGAPKVNEKNLFLITDVISSTKGIEFIQYCPKDKLLLMTYDNSLYSTKSSILDIFKNKNINMQMFIKEGDFKTILQNCKE